ncbi:hypothetical protein Q7A53_05830 [Halobacillus rhizosphaerae]|uniref:hypothetical protein n=1 Tax=Halobacillus rhizosphaerae TaxID=3064889 RepID=UPI00398AC525
MITWHYNRFGHVSIWKGEIENPCNNLESDIYLQIDTDVEAFFEHIGMNIDEVYPDDWDTCSDSGYFE